MYHLPYRYTALTKRQMDFWDVVYYLAHLGGGRIVVSSQELASLAGLSRKKITPLIRDALTQGELEKDIPLDPPGPWHYELIIPDYHTETNYILKPQGYVANGWLRLIRSAMPKRLLNHLLHQTKAQEQVIPFDPALATLALRRISTNAPIAYERVQAALDVLIYLGLIQPLSGGYLRPDLGRFDTPAPLEVSLEEESKQYREAYVVDPLHAHRALKLVRSGNLSFERDFERVFRHLGNPAVAVAPFRLREGLRSARHLPIEERWDWVIQRLERWSTPSATKLWPTSRRRAWRHTHLALESLKREKYRPAVYAPRPVADAAFARFCQGHRPALALVGPAGVGKSSTLAHWAEEMLDEGHAVLLYPAPALASGPDDLLDRLAQDLDLPTHPAFFISLSSPLYIFIDALNEAPNPFHLTAAINTALGTIATDSTYLSLRFVLSCRQGTWERLARRGLPYPTLLYNDGSIPLGPFDDEELVDAFTRYQAHYGLQSNLNKLSPSLRHLLRMPLLLALSADTYRDSPLPVIDPGSEVIKRYLEQKLSRPTHVLLLRRIVTLMAEMCSLALPLARLWTDPIAASLIARNGLDAPYPRLLSEGLIEESVTPDSDVEIRFTYERVFEYLLGQVALPEHLSRGGLAALLTESTSFPSLRNAAISRLTTYSNYSNLLLIESMAADPNPGLRGLARDALIVRHEQGDTQVDACLYRLIHHANPEAIHTALAVALERRAPPLILMATFHPNPLARQQGVLYTYYLWRRDREQGWSLLNDLSQRAVKRFGLPHRRSLETLLRVTTLIIVQHLSPETFTELQPLITLWRDLLRRIPLVGSHSALAIRARSILIAVGDRTLVSLFKSISLNEAVPTKGRGEAYAFLESLYSLPAQEKQFLSQRLDALDPELTSIRGPDTAQALLDLARKGPVNWLLWILVGDALASHHRYEPTATKALIKQMLNSAEELVYWCAVSGTSTIAEQGQPNSAAELTISLNDRLERWERERTETENAFFFFARTMMAELRAGRPNPTLPARLLEPDWARDNPDAIVILLYSLEGLAYLGYPLPALRALYPHFDDGRPPVRTVLVKILRRLLVLYPDDVNFFLEEAPSDLREDIYVGQPPTILWQLIGRRAQDTWPMLFAIVPTRRFMLNLLRQTLPCPDWTTARRLVIELLIETLIE